MGAISNYVIGLASELLGEEPDREKLYPWALGDVSAKTGHARRLPFDAVWEKRRLIVEVDEDQHRRPVSFWDKPDVLTVSGVHRGEQRHLYDERKRAAARREVIRSSRFRGSVVPYQRNEIEPSIYRPFDRTYSPAASRPEMAIQSHSHD